MQYLAWSDLVVLVVLALCALIGLLSGFLWQSLRVAVVVAAFWLTGLYHEHAAGLLGEGLTEEGRLLVAYCGLFAALLVGGNGVLSLLRRLLGSPPATMTGRVPAIVMGVLAGWLICGTFALGMLKYARESNFVEKNVNGAPVLRASAVTVDLLEPLLSLDEEEPGDR